MRHGVRASTIAELLHRGLQMAARSSDVLRFAGPHRGAGRRAGIILRGCTGGPVDAQGSYCVVAQGGRSTRSGHAARLPRMAGRRAVDMLRGCRGWPVDAQWTCCAVAEDDRWTRSGHVARFASRAGQRAGINVRARRRMESVARHPFRRRRHSDTGNRYLLSPSHPGGAAT
jgi:hypothetical protein